MMNILLIGGTGTISTAITEKLATSEFYQLTLLNRGTETNNLPSGVEVLQGDIRNKAEIAKLIEGRTFDVVADFISFDTTHVETAYELFKSKTKQFIFISTASAYQKPAVDPVITESTPLSNPYWGYSRNKIKCEEWLMEKFRQEGFPVTIIRPSHTYGNKSVPVCLYGNSSWQVLKRMIEGKPVIIPGDGNSLWTMTHNSDFADGFIGLLGNVHAIGHAIHITNNENLTWNQAHTVIANQLGVKLNPLYVPTDLLIHAGKKFGYDFEGPLLGDKSCTVIFDNTKIKKLVPTFNASIRFDQGMAQNIPHILANPELQIEDPEYDAFCDEMVNVMQQAFDVFS